MSEPQCLTTLWASTACYRNSFTYQLVEFTAVCSWISFCILLANMVSKFASAMSYISVHLLSPSDICKASLFTCSCIMNKKFSYVYPQSIIIYNLISKMCILLMSFSYYSVCCCYCFVKNLHHLNTHSVRFVTHNLKLSHHFHVLIADVQIVYQT
jgi:hypothetical protein